MTSAHWPCSWFYGESSWATSPRLWSAAVESEPDSPRPPECASPLRSTGACPSILSVNKMSKINKSSSSFWTWKSTSDANAIWRPIRRRLSIQQPLVAGTSRLPWQRSIRPHPPPPRFLLGFQSGRFSALLMTRLSVRVQLLSTDSQQQVAVLPDPFQSLTFRNSRRNARPFK